MSYGSRKANVAAQLMLVSAMSSLMYGGSKSSDPLYIPVQKHYDPWSKIQLTKSERKGKTFEEINALRKAKWEAMNNEKKESDSKIELSEES